MEKFPDHIDAPFTGNGNGSVSARTPSPFKANGHTPGRWLPVSRQDSQARSGLGWSASGRSHTRQKSLGEALHTIRTRNGSVSQNAHEIADALRAPISPKLIVRFAFPSIADTRAEMSDTDVTRNRSCVSCGTPPPPSRIHHQNLS